MKVAFIIYDNEAHICCFPLGVAYLTAVLQKAGHDVIIYQQDIHHWPESHLTQWLDANQPDLVGLSFIGGYWQYHKSKKIAQAIALSEPRKKGKMVFALGGHGPSPEPDFFLRKLEADIVCIGEGEETILDLCQALESRRSLDTVPGIAYMQDAATHINPRRELIQDIDALPFPAYHRFPMEVYRLLALANSMPTDFCISMLSGRGCTFRCNFCYRMDKGFRPRSNEAIIEEIRYLQKDFGIIHFEFMDDLLMSSVKRTTSLCEDFLKHKVNIKWNCNGRLNYAKRDLLDLMKRAGCVFINYGIESFDDATLRIMHKGLTTQQITRGIEATLAAGISPGLNIIFGNINENLDTLQKDVDFLLKYDEGCQLRTIRPVTPYPGSELYTLAIQKGLLEGPEDFYENKHKNSDLLTVNFTKLTDDEFYSGLHHANATLLHNYAERNKKQYEDILHELYTERNPSFRGFRHT